MMPSTIELNESERSASRTEHDLLGELPVPATALYGVHTVRALRNFPRGGTTIADVGDFAAALGMVKLAAARANLACGELSPATADAICLACRELIDGDPRLREALVLPLLQGGAGTSTNMNVNEVIANRALEHLGYPLGAYEHCHPNDHVNRSQSTNDVYPTALRVALILRHRTMRHSLDHLIETLHATGARFSDVPKLGRTQLRDAVPMTFGDAAWADGCTAAVRDLDAACELLHEVNLGGTAVGTGLTASRDYTELAVAHLAVITSLPVRLARRLVSATTDSSGLLSYSAAIRTAAVAVAKLANDLRLLSSVPGKVNPVVPEYANQAAFRIRGLDTTVVLALDAAQLQLNAMLPVVAEAFFEAQELLAGAATALADNCVASIEINEPRTRDNAREGLGEMSVLAGTVGYEESSRLTAQAEASGVVPAKLLTPADPRTDPEEPC
jgi:aspartate ammonia-lyase